MAALPQLLMRKADLSDLPALSQEYGRLPEGYHLHTHAPGDEAAWEALLQKSFGLPLPFSDNMTACPGYHPSQVFYLRDERGQEVAVAAAVEHRDFPGEGWLHYVAVDPAERGKRLSYAVVLPCLYSFYTRGFGSVVLSTDDHRLPAIRCYLNLGFAPLLNHPSHPARWQTVMEVLK